MHTTTARILAQNSGRDLERLTLKCAALRADPFAFFRGTNSLFLSQLPRRRLPRSPCTLICGDLHLENFGAFKGDNRLVYFDLNDFDESCLAPLTLDLVRFVACLHVAGPVLKVTRATVASLIEGFLGAYTEALGEGKPRWIERSLAQGVFATLLERAAARPRDALLERLTRLKDGTRRLRLGARALPAEATTRAPIKALLRDLPAPGGHPKFYKLLDMANRVAGNGSLGLPRWVLLTRGRGGPGGEFLLDLKFAAPSAPAAWWRGRQPHFASDAERVVALQRILQAIPPALLQPVRLGRQPYVLKELQPAVDRLQLAAWHDRPKRLVQAVRGMGQVTAWAQLRACGHLGAAPAEALARFAAGAWAKPLTRLAAIMAERTLQAHADYAQDYDAGAVVAVLKKAAPGAPRRKPRARR